MVTPIGLVLTTATAVKVTVNGQGRISAALVNGQGVLGLEPAMLEPTNY